MQAVRPDTGDIQLTLNRHGARHFFIINLIQMPICDVSHRGQRMTIRKLQKRKVQRIRFLDHAERNLSQVAVGLNGQSGASDLHHLLKNSPLLILAFREEISRGQHKFSWSHPIKRIRIIDETGAGNNPPHAAGTGQQTNVLYL